MVETPKFNPPSVDEPRDKNSPIKRKEGMSDEEKAKSKEEARVDKERDELIAKRLGESPDLSEAVEKLKTQVLAVKKYFDGSYHREKAASGELVLISELQTQVDKLNQDMKTLRDSDELLFRAVDAWGEIAGMPITPDTITLSFPKPGSGAVLRRYIGSGAEGTVAFPRPMYMQIDKSGFRLIDLEKTDSEKRPTSTIVDSMLFDIASKDPISDLSYHDDRMQYGSGSTKEYYDKTLIKRIKEYGLAVRTSPYPLAENDQSMYLYIDLSPLKTRNQDGRYLSIRVADDGTGSWSKVSMSRTDRQSRRFNGATLR